MRVIEIGILLVGLATVVRLDQTAIRATDNELRGMACVSEIDMILAILKCIGRVLVLGANCVVGIALVVLLATGRDHTRVQCVLLTMTSSF